MKLMRQLIILVLLLIYIVLPVQAADEGVFGATAPFLRFGVGARAFGMGGAYVAVADDATATYWNPAGLAQLNGNQLSAMHTELFMETKYDYLGVAFPTAYGGWGLSLLNIMTPFTSEFGETKNVRATVGYLGYGFELDKWQFGLSLKYLQQELLQANAQAFSCDLGFNTQLAENFFFGFSVRDFWGARINWSTNYQEEIPITYLVGLSYQMENLILSLQLERTLGVNLEHFGLEYEVNDFLKLRAGARGQDLTFGIGISQAALGFDYAYCAAELGNTHRFSLNFAW